ncbi:hypothetical protein M409DRAFT_56049 [Zasmidium cellare ATCC 36951]|uniref:Uncharacterized protein n=1 Tax=Zasmidium cellare ATCC 36951 TaxID=1080233 RepID=A0A6A6CHJ7_ZASCE|nr:uncharacterized protein M409DRAFT_56049 [Zasmidium cellare ATCC 36951]KAF2165169.1 hypothetical protein M409DRAFT_56049 [Zasmidium cellare ATCC 36951]
MSDEPTDRKRKAEKSVTPDEDRTPDKTIKSEHNYLEPTSYDPEAMGVSPMGLERVAANIREVTAERRREEDERRRQRDAPSPLPQPEQRRRQQGEGEDSASYSPPTVEQLWADTPSDGEASASGPASPSSRVYDSQGSSSSFKTQISYKMSEYGDEEVKEDDGGEGQSKPEDDGGGVRESKPEDGDKMKDD